MVDLSQMAQRNKLSHQRCVCICLSSWTGRFLVCARFLRNPARLAPASASVLANNSHSKRDSAGSLETGCFIPFCVGGISVRKGF